MSILPVEHVIPDLLAALAKHPAVVLQAPPGAGKTTRVPLALLNAPFLNQSGIIMLEPRRLAAVNAARWMAASLKEQVGRTVGFSIRFERQVSQATRIEVVTEGILTRRLQSDPLLTGVGVVIFDEFHERSLNADLALALCRDVQCGLREELKIIVMSATLDGGAVAALLGDAPVITSRGESFPVEIRYLPREAEGDASAQTCEAIRRALRETEGDILAFLPGSGEIRRCQRFLAELRELPRAPLICPLYGDLPFAAQEQAIMPGDRRKVVLATNIAETSLTIEGVRVVVDSGWSRQLRFDPASGLNRLVTVRVSAASATQRAGRAGRLGPGICYRLWTEHAQRSLLPFTPPEIRSADLTSLVLDLAQWGVTDAASLNWLDPPPGPALSEARRLLKRLGGLDRQGMITAIGRRMAAIPAHPRLAHLLLLARDRGYGSLACDMVALLSERDLLRSTTVGGALQSSPSDMLDRLEALAGWRRKGGGARDASGVDPHACRAVDQASRHFRHLLGSPEPPPDADPETVGLLLAWAYPDRVARQREPGGGRYLIANGRGGSLSQRSAVRNQPFIIAYSMEGGEQGDGAIHQASAISLATLRREFADQLVTERLVEWDGRQARVAAREEERLDAVVLGSRPITPAVEELRAALLKGIAVGPGLAALGWTSAARQLLARARFLSRHVTDRDWPDFSEQQLAATLDTWLGPCLAGVKSLAELAALDLLPPLKALFTWEQLRLLDEGAPPHCAVPSGSRIPLDYGADGPPVLAVKLQELFGLADTPTVAWGKVPVLLHLLSPARRPIQVTQDLRSFWNTIYPEVKKELKGRYPRHPWPDDPWNAVPTRGVKKREKR